MWCSFLPTELIENEVRGLRDAMQMLPARTAFDQFFKTKSMHFEAADVVGVLTPLMSPTTAAAGSGGAPRMTALSLDGSTALASSGTGGSAAASKPVISTATVVHHSDGADGSTIRWAKQRETQLATQLASVYAAPTPHDHTR